MIRAAAQQLEALLARLLVLVIRGYQWFLSPLLGGQCRFEPSCSHYGIACIHEHGPLRGSWFTLRRLLRCHPFHPGGFDPPPRKRSAIGQVAPTHTSLKAHG